MPRPSPVSLWLASLALCLAAALPRPAPAEEPMRIALRPATVPHHATPDLLADLDRWLDTRLQWPARDAPTIRYVSPREAARRAGTPDRGHGRLRGYYDPDSRTISLVTPWSAENAMDVSVLLHELVHHRQAPHHFYCPAAQEPAAYDAQRDWLAERGLPLDVNRFAITWHAGCTPRDIHPE